MKIQNNKGGITLIASGVGDDRCPRVIVKGARSTFRDDYYGALSLKKGIAAALFKSV